MKEFLLNLRTYVRSKRNTSVKHSEGKMVSMGQNVIDGARLEQKQFKDSLRFRIWLMRGIKDKQ